MNRWMAGGAGGVISAGLLVALAVPGLAQGDPEYDEFQREADVVPTQPQPGEQVTVSDDTCHEGASDIWWAVQAPAGGSIQELGQVSLAGDGSWEVTFLAPGEPGDYRFFGLCLPPGVDEPDAATIALVMDEDLPVELLDEWGVHSLTYYAMIVTVVGEDGTTTTTTPPVPDPSTTTTTTPASPSGPAPAATPVPATPTFTG
jgi:hypothetical protein